jgi:aspartate/methionine/tyrosine aminotransferase
VLPEAPDDNPLGLVLGRLLSAVVGQLMQNITDDLRQRADEARVAREAYEASRPIPRLRRSLDRWFRRFFPRSTAPPPVALPQTAEPPAETAP